MNESHGKPQRLTRLAKIAGGGTAAAGIALTAAITLGVSETGAVAEAPSQPTTRTSSTPPGGSSSSSTTGSVTDSTDGLSTAPPTQPAQAGSHGS